VPLTPKDVHAKQFTPTRFKPGYDEDEVDAFLDQVETELAGLLAENERLRAELDSLRGGAAAAGGATNGVATEAAPEQPRAVPERPAPAPEAAAPAAPGAAIAVPGQDLPPVTAAQAELEEMTRRTLLLAQRAANEVVSEAHAEAERMLAEATAAAERTVEEARGRAEGAERAAAARQAADLARYTSQRQQLAEAVERLSTFEREYRTRLRAYLEMQLREVESAPETVMPEAAGLTRVAPAMLGPGSDGTPVPEPPARGHQV